MAVVKNYPPNKVGELKDYVNSCKKLELSRNNLVMKVRQGDVICPYQSLLSRYHGALSQYVIEYELSDEEYKKYRYNPTLFCIDCYGTPELWADILYLNNMVSSTEFTKRKLKIFASTIIDACSELIMLAEEDLKANKREVSDED